MWTPRRILLLLVGVFLFAGVYLTYDRLLGWIDGLPQLPPGKTMRDNTGFKPPPRPTDPTDLRIIAAFGADSPEDRDRKAYETRLTILNGESMVVLAASPPMFTEGSRRVYMSPFSMAVFGKPKPADGRPPDEADEISTFHADKAVLEFDQVVANAYDMNKAKLVRMELVSGEFDNLPGDPRRGMVYITNNQRSADPAKAMVLRTPGPVFYRDPKTNPPDGGADIWADAPVEITDRQNLPRAFAPPGAKTAPSRAEDLRTGAAVSDIVAGRRTPPPTATAIGMRVFCEPARPATDPKAATKKGSAGFSGVRKVELLEKVVINLWTDASQSFVGSSGDGKPRAGAQADPKAAAKPPEKKGGGSGLNPPEPPGAVAAVVGGLHHGAQAARQLDRVLLQIETPGRFTYDVEKNVARWDAAPQADPNVLNDVQVTRVPPKGRGGVTTLFSQVLEVEFTGAPTAGPAAPPPPGQPPQPAGGAFKRLHAWVTAPDRFVSMTSEEDKLYAYGQDLVHEQEKETTELKGFPLTVRNEGGNVLVAGGPAAPGLLTMKPGPDRRSTTTVHGPGRIEILDDATRENTILATWTTSLVHTKEPLNGKDVDRLAFTGGAVFKDVKADYWIKGDTLVLWLTKSDTPAAKDERAADRKAGQMLPHRLQAVGHVESDSADFVVKKADHLNVYFRDVPPPAPKVEPKAAQAAPAPAPAPPGPPAPAPPPPAVAQAEPAPKEPEKPKPPLKVTARVIDTWVVRYPVKPAGKPAPKPGATPANDTTLKYELERARCEGTATERVEVHQDPDDPAAPRGVDIFGLTLHLDQTRDGSIMVVKGTDEKPGEVHYEQLSILGPVVNINQPDNLTTVKGRGTLVMPAGSDLAGNELAAPEVITVHWRDEMVFEGGRKYARFVGKVFATQRDGDSWIVCHNMRVVLDKPVYFNQLARPTTPPKPAPRPGDKKDPDDDKPKVELVYCDPAPDDAADERRDAQVSFQERVRDENGRVVKMQQLTARDIQVKAKAKDDQGNPYQLVTASGPGVVRLWQPGTKDAAAGPGAPTAPGAKPAQPETEMKLTVVGFKGRMTAKDKGKVLQESQFYDNVQVTNVPTDDPALDVARAKDLPGMLFLTCTRQLNVATYKPTKPGASPEQYMTARGNAFIRTPEHEGSGEVVTSVGSKLTLYGIDEEQPGTRGQKARINGRLDNTSGQTGERIVYDRATGRYDAFGAGGGSFQAPAPQPMPPAGAPPRPR